MCRYKGDCAFEHNTSKDNKNIEELDKEEAVLRAEIQHLSKTTRKKN